MIKITHIKELDTYTTKDNSLICELMHPTQHGNAKQSLAQATVPCNTETQLHYHTETEELYHVTQGSGLMTIDTTQFPVTVGDTICIPPNSHHKIKNTCSDTLIFLCCCSPAYSHDDTYIINED